MKTNRFTDLFMQYGWTVVELGENSYIAYNDTYFVPFSCVPQVRDTNVYASAVSYLICDKEAFIEAWKNYNIKNEKRQMTEYPIGFYAFSNWMNRNGYGDKFTHFGGVANHDHSAFEIECWLKRIHK